jgi:hypothetical protein
MWVSSCLADTTKEHKSSLRLEASKDMPLAKAAITHHVCVDAQLFGTQTYHLRVSMLLSASHCFGLAALPLQSTSLLANATAAAAAVACEQIHHPRICHIICYNMPQLYVFASMRRTMSSRMLLLLLLLLLLLPLLTLLEHASPVRLCFYEAHDVVTDGALELVANLVALIDQRHHLHMQ